MRVDSETASTDGVVPEVSTRRRGYTLSGRDAYALVAGVVGLGLFASVTPSPLYQTYATLWHFSSLTLTLVYATYAFGVLTTLLLAGSVSDQVGRRPTLLVALTALMGSTIVYLLAASVAWLFVARGLQGLATGAALSAASAAMLDLKPNHDAAGVGITNAVVSAGGIALGILISSSLIELGWESQVLPYLVLLGLFGAALVGVWVMPEPVTKTLQMRITPRWPSVPTAIRGPFLLASLAALASWSIGGLFFSLGPELSDDLFKSMNVVVSAVGVVALAGSATVAGLIFGRILPWIAASAGSLALAAGVIMIVTATAIGSSPIYLTGSVLGGMGFGLAFLGGLRGLVSVIPERDRGAVMSAFYVVAYASLSVPAVVAGALVPRLGLRPTFEVFGLIAAAAALIVAVEAYVTRPVGRPGMAQSQVGRRGQTTDLEHPPFTVPR
jgi:MFS family permease